MSELDKIIGHIREDSSAAASKTLAEAREQADSIIAQAGKEAAQIKAAADKTSELRKADARSRQASSAGLIMRRTLLTEKQQLIADVLEGAKNALLAMPDDKYFEFILQLVKKNAAAAAGKILFGKKDLDRLPANFEKKLADCVPEGGSLKVSQTPAAINGGFLLSYDEIEENCGVDALFETNAEELQDTVAKLLFS